MKAYQKKRNIVERAAPSTVSILPVFNVDSDPVAGQEVARWFDQTGNFLGWTDAVTSRKFLMGKLYYKTKGAYRIKTRRSHTDRAVKKIFIYEKASNALAAYVIERQLDKKDLVDLNDKRTLAQVTIEKIQAHGFTHWNFTEYPNPYNVIPAEFKQKLHKDMQEFLNAKKAELIALCQSEIDTVNTYANAESEIGWQISNAV